MKSTHPPEKRVVKALGCLPCVRMLESETQHSHTSITVHQLQCARAVLGSRCVATFLADARDPSLPKARKLVVRFASLHSEIKLLREH